MANYSWIDTHNISTVNLSARNMFYGPGFNMNTTLDTIPEPGQPKWMYWTIGPVICSFGIVCNIINLLVLHISQRELHDSPYTYLKALSFSDLSLLTMSFIHLVISKAPNTFSKAFYNVYIFFPIANVCFNSSVWIIVGLTIQRMFFVIRPLTTRPSRKKTRMVICAIFLSCVLINLPRFFCYEIYADGHKRFPRGTAFRDSRLFHKLSWFHAIVINFLPNVILIVTNTTLIYALHKAGNDRKSLRSNREKATLRDQTRLTRTLIAIVIVFFICTIPSAFVDDPIAYSLFGKGRTWTEYIDSSDNQLFKNVSNLLIFLNSSLNFMLYCAFNKKFRTATRCVFKKCMFRIKSPCLRHDSTGIQYSVCRSSRTLSTKV